jgi:hypothetical protein
MGALYHPAGDNSPNAPPLSGVLLKFRVDKDCTVSIQENTVRGGVVLTNPSVDPTVNATSCGPVTCLSCFPCNYSTYSDWVKLGMPMCWCDRVSGGSGYQCDGDADNLVQGLPKYRVYTNDFNILVANWKKIIQDPSLNPCADFDHKPQGLVKYRVYTNDFNILVGNWKKTDAQLPGNCLRGQ